MKNEIGVDSITAGCWLRCVKCYNPATGKRLLTTTEDDQPDSIQFDNEGVEIKWKNGQSSQFICSWLLENSYCHHNGQTTHYKASTDLVPGMLNISVIENYHQWIMKST